MENGVKKKTFNTGFTSHLLLNFSESGKVYCCASSAIQFSTLLSISTLDGKVEILKKSQPIDIDEGYLSEFTEICYNTTDGGKSYANYYKPTNKDYEGPDDELPPLLVKAHGGPTGSTTTCLQLSVQYFTSRGFAVLDVSYRGSTGYGREYRLKLDNKWGIYDVDDCCAAAQHLADNKLVDKNKLCIDGGSAGGYTTLACLASKDVFKAGACSYGVTDLELEANETNKFHSRYLDRLIGVYPQQRDIYIQRSPIHNVDGFNYPIIFFQGTEDKVVPPNQAQMMFDSVEKKGIPCSLIMFEGEQHGFRKSENIQTALDGELYFYSKILKFEADLPDGISDKISISNYA
ncbi:hypothetical protein EB796_011553 [Bugula neritina]|uniref:Peptidase S9 prolyl oligopeptidase catalytic domain-containing protein n=1 Tax=Bugula neritina TaxID=10212 RepID=A0A7J7JWT4_BUGNE|nr:hypothetical protein EB796_011553 [Bugula neritina]